MPDYFVDHREVGGNYVNGVILLRTLDAERMRVSSFTVWNPSIRKSIEINPPGRLLAQHIRVGLGYESRSHDLKVVVMVCEETPWRDCPAPNPTQVPFPIWVHVYSLKSRAWSSSKVQTQWFKSLRFEDRSVFFNGAIHWVGCDVGMVPYPLYGSHVVAFNVKNEVFSTFGLPDGRAVNHSRVLAVVGESLALLDLYPGYSVVWVMEKYVTVKQEGLKMYEIKSMKIKDLAKSYRDKLVFVDTFVESLLLLTDDNND
ncbi:hypothetical protein Cgig2_000613 [Carnegiea gigantea]|uniref:F-box associated beta-propeller type 1 domain-containing protein n=1 Tax=Carnegiea gigantea TaxID=171969 RepID=A0A9Q1GH74_9CARY|nr:hypothetical protein Cgig2_000613 [Carnegiea gigantea]